MTKELSKEELMALVEKLNNQVEALTEQVAVAQTRPEGRKKQVYDILKTGHITVDAIAIRLGISARNVSSQMSYLRKDGVAIATDSLGRKFIESDAVTQPAVKAEVKTLHEAPAKAKVITRKASNE